MSVVLQSNQVPSAEAIRAATREILDRPEFTEPSRWWQIFFEMVKAIKEWLDALSAWSVANPVLARVLFVIALLVLLVCLAHLLYLALADVLPFGRKKNSPPTRSNRWSWRSRSTFACVPGLMSPISSRKSIPPFASRDPRP